MSPSRSIPSPTACRARAAFATVTASGWLITAAHAHGFGQRYDLPLPLSFYLFGAAATVVVTFIIVALLIRDHPPSPARPRTNILHTSLGHLIAHPFLIGAAKFLVVIAFFVTIAAAFFGDQNPYRNIAPTMVWIIGWVGIAYVSAFVGNLWAVLNPWRTLFAMADYVWRAATGRSELSLNLSYPAAVGVWPAFVLLLALSWVELVYPNPAVPRFLGTLAVAYSLLTFAGMFLFGRETWLRHGEVFSAVFGTFARFAPLELSTGREPRLQLRPFGAGLLDTSAVSTSMMAFVLLLLASVLYDGALATPEWGRLENVLAPHFSIFGNFKLMGLRSAGLLAFWLIFFGAYICVSAVMSLTTAGRLSTPALARNFALTLVPIAIGYHLAHYLTFLLIQGQYIIPLVSDPFGYGWDLFGTAGYRVDIGIVDARFAWYAAVAAILMGHIAAVYLAHRKAIALLDTRAAILRSQVPLTALMVVYTFISLSILAEPMVERRAPAQPSAIGTELTVPQDAVLPEAGTGRLVKVGAGTTARQKLTYRVLGSAFHDGTRMTAADLIYSYMFAYRWGAGARKAAAPADALIAAATSVMRERLIGIRVVGTDTTSKSFRFGDFEYVRELLVIEVYTSAAPLDPEQDAVVGPPWSTVPWHLLVLMEEAVTRGWAAFSQVEAQRKSVEWLDLARSPEMNARLAQLVESFEREGYRPGALQQLVGEQDARRRWAALRAFHRERGHFFVTNGPYQLKRWSADSVTVDAFRDLSYPLGVGSFDAYAVPRRGFITKIEQAKGRIRLFGDIELLEKHMRSYDLVRRPLQSIAADVIRRSAPECRYVVRDDAGRVVVAGQIPISADATFELDLHNKLPSGRFTLAAQIIVNGNAMNAEIRNFTIAAGRAD